MASRDDQFWAEFLGVSPSDWSTPGISVRPHAGLIGYRGLWCFRCQDRTVVSVPRGWVAHFSERLADCDQDKLFEEAFLRELVGADFERIIGPAFQGCLDPGRFRPVSAPEVRFVGSTDGAAIDRFRLECGADDLASSALDKVRDHLAAFFQGTKIVALAGYRPWSDVAGDPCVLTYLDVRGRGYGTAVVSAVVAQALQDGKLLLYQTLEANQGAVHIALKLGYERYARYVAVRLKRDAP